MKKLLYIILFTVVCSSMPYAYFQQGSWRWRNDNGTEAAATWKENEQTSIILSDKNNIRLRVEVFNGHFDGNPSPAYNTGLAYSKDESNWTVITADPAGKDFVLSGSANITDMSDITTPRLNQMSGNSHFTGKVYESSYQYNLSIPSAQSTELEFCIRATDNASPNSNYYFSVIRSAGDLSTTPAGSLELPDNYTSESSGGTTGAKLTAASALPVELTSFTGRLKNSRINLQWETATEINNYGFEIQRRQNERWERIGFVKGNGNSSSPKRYSFADSKLSSAGKYIYRLKQLDNDGVYEYSDQVEVEFEGFAAMLNQNYPNPFNPVTSISYAIPVSGSVTLKVYNMIGQEVKTLVSSYQEAGEHTIRFDGSDLNSGVYIYKLQSGSFTSVRKMQLVK